MSEFDDRIEDAMRHNMRLASEDRKKFQLEIAALERQLAEARRLLDEDKAINNHRRAIDTCLKPENGI